MASFTPPEPPFEPGEPTPPPALDVPLPPPEVGFGSPWAPADAENRDRILDWWRMWWRRVFFPWIAAFIAYWNDQWNRLAAYVNTWIAAADEYITEHAIAGYSFRVTATPINPTGTTDVTFTGIDTEHRPLVIGDLVLDETVSSNYGIITVLIDATHATVAALGTLKGYAGHGWWVTADPISATGTTDVSVTPEADRAIQINDLVSDESSALRYGIVTALIDATHVTVSPLGVLRGLPGFGWWSTATPITHAGTTAVVLSAGPDRLPQINDLVVDDTTSGAYGEITIVTDATHVTVAFVGLLQGPQGDPGVVQSIVPGDNIAVDDTDPANPIVSATAGGGVVVQIEPGDNVMVDNTDPTHPIVSATGGGGGSTVYATQTLLYAATTTEGDTYTVANAPGLTWTLTASGWAIAGTLIVQDSDSITGLFDSDFYTGFFDGSGNELYVLHLYSGITYRWSDANHDIGMPWDSDWINSPPGNFIDWGVGEFTVVPTGMLKFSSGVLEYVGYMIVGTGVDIGTPMGLYLDALGIVTDPTAMPTLFPTIGECVLTDGTSTWRGLVQSDSGTSYFLIVPDLAGSTNFGSDIWAGEVGADVNHTWAVASVFSWSIRLPMSPTETTYNDGRSDTGEFPVGGGAGGSGLIYPHQVGDSESLTIPTQAGVYWTAVYGTAIPASADWYAGDGVQSSGAVFSAGNLVEIDGGGFTPVANLPVRFNGITGISGLTDGTQYYIKGITGTAFTVSATPGGAVVPFTGTGTSDTAEADYDDGDVLTKATQYQYVQLFPNQVAPYIIGYAPYFNWLLYSF